MLYVVRSGHLYNSFFKVRFQNCIEFKCINALAFSLFIKPFNANIGIREMRKIL